MAGKRRLKFRTGAMRKGIDIVKLEREGMRRPGRRI